MESLIDQMAREASRRVAARTELDILCGCADCGARLIENGQPVDDAGLLEIEAKFDEAKCSLTLPQFVPLCGKCLPLYRLQLASRA